MTSPATPSTTTSSTAPSTARSSAPAGEASTPADQPVTATGDRASTRADASAKARRSPDLRAGARRAASLTGAGIRRLRTMVGEVVWIICLLAAAALLLGTALVVVGANTHNALVQGVLHAADWADLGVFSRSAGIKQFTGDGAATKNALMNWGLGAVAWLVVGRIARRILTP
ncbi:hypothetical protein [Terrabacter sp. NPDC080008]|uniref:hypothetical protein n=1 Tax=Terrabacter sp. NPDC080008 TaxID=3155176 RepID=UPI00344B54F9